MQVIDTFRADGGAFGSQTDRLLLHCDDDAFGAIGGKKLLLRFEPLIRLEFLSNQFWRCLIFASELL